MRVTNPEDNEPVAIENVVAIRETEKALLCRLLDIYDEEESHCDEADVWIAKSQIRDESEVYSLKSTGMSPGKLVIPRWLAREKGIEE